MEFQWIDLGIKNAAIYQPTIPEVYQFQFFCLLCFDLIFIRKNVFCCNVASEMWWNIMIVMILLLQGLWGSCSSVVQSSSGFWPQCICLCGHQGKRCCPYLGYDNQPWGRSHLLGEFDSSQVLFHLNIKNFLIINDTHGAFLLPEK